MSSENKYINDQYKGFFEDSLSKTDPDLFKAIYKFYFTYPKRIMF